MNFYLKNIEMGETHWHSEHHIIPAFCYIFSISNLWSNISAYIWNVRSIKMEEIWFIESNHANYSISHPYYTLLRCIMSEHILRKNATGIDYIPLKTHFQFCMNFQEQFSMVSISSILLSKYGGWNLLLNTKNDIGARKSMTKGIFLISWEMPSDESENIR